MKKRCVLPSIMLLLPILAGAYLLFCLETYDRVVHNESGLLVTLLALLLLFAEIVLWLCEMILRKKHGQRRWTCIVLACVCTAMLAGVAFLGTRIPFCVECDRVTAEELGFLTHWIKPWQGGQ